MILGVVGAAALLLGIGGVTGGAIVFTNCSLSSLKPVTMGENSFVYAADGSLLGSIQTAQNRQVVQWNEISGWMPKAVVAIEDRRFYHHGGVDYVGIVRAAIADLRARKTVQGASTITQQLARNLYISNHERTISRKLKEVCLARKLDQAWSKQDILTAYMNQVFYGANAYGVEAAAETYFSEHASQLTLVQAALLAGLPQAPSSYDPFYNKPAALTRRNEVLKAMLDNNDINHAQYEKAVAAPIRLKSGKIYKNIREPYFFDYVTDQLVDQYGAATVRSGGLHVYTTINPRMQRLARKAIRDNLYYRTDPASAVIAIDPRTGAIKAMTGVIPVRRTPSSPSPLRPSASPDRLSRPSFSPRQFHRAWTRTRPTTPRHPLPTSPIRASRPGRCTRTATPTPARSRWRARRGSPTTPSLLS